MTKKCCKCKETLPIEEFSKNKTKFDGYASYCKHCSKDYLKSYRIENKEKLKQIQKESYRRKIQKQRQKDKELWKQKN